MKARRVLTYIGIGVIFGFTLSPLAAMLLDTFSHTTRSVKNRNTEIIERHAGIASLLYSNSDLLMRIAHYVDRHPPSGEVMCPVCANAEPNRVVWPELPVEPVPPENLPDTIAQLADDADEIHMAAGSAMYSLMVQRETLERFLWRMSGR